MKLIATGDIVHLYREENVRTLRARLPHIFAVSVAVTVLAWLVENSEHPGRDLEFAAHFAAGMVVLGFGALWVKRTLSAERVMLISLCVALAEIALVTSYEICVAGEAEALALAHVSMLVAAMAFLPWGLRGQVVLVGASLACYLLAVSTRVTAVAPIGHLVLGLACIGGLTVGSAGVINGSRFRLFRRADEMREANAELERGNRALREANRVKMEFLANVSHEFRTPLTVIIGFTQLAREGAFGTMPRDAVDPLGRVLTHSRILLGLVNDFLDFSRLEANRLRLHFGNASLEPLFEELQELVEPLFQHKPVRLSTTVEKGLQAYADSDRLRQVLLNLLTNAVKFTDMGRIDLRARREGSEVVIEVADTGSGIASSEHESIFHPFHRGPETDQISGVGIGLALSRQLTEAMGGTLGVTSEPGHGSTFFVRLRAGVEQVGAQAQVPEDGSVAA